MSAESKTGVTVDIRLLRVEDIAPMVAAFQTLGWGKPWSQYERYLAEQAADERVVHVAFADGVFAGYVTVLWQSHYPPFHEASIPEVNDFNVLPEYRRRGIGSRLMDAAEQTIAQRSSVVGIGVGLYADYGTAQRMYVKRGYVPDGRGVTYNNVPVTPGASAPVDDDLVLWFTKQLRG